MSLNPRIFYKSWLHTEHDPEGPGPDEGRRWVVFRLVVVGAFLILAARLLQLQVLETNRLQAAAANNVTRRMPVEAQRGVIYDRHGAQLTANVPLWDVSLTLAEMPEAEEEYQAALRRLERRLGLGSVVSVYAEEVPPEQRGRTVQRVAAALGVPSDRVSGALDESRETGVPVLVAEDLGERKGAEVEEALEGVPGVRTMLALQWRVEYEAESRFSPSVVAERVPRETALAIEGDRLLIPGVSIRQVPARAYPHGETFASVLGYVGDITTEQVDELQRRAAAAGQRPYALDETVGRTGLESVLEPYLRGTPGAQEVEVTSSNRVIREGRLEEPVQGHNVRLTLDAGLQRAAMESLARAVEDSGAKSGAVVALDPRTGQVLALVSFPTYDNNFFVRGLSPAEFAAIQNDPGAPLLDKATAGTYQPSEILRPFVAAGALAERVVEADTRHPCTTHIEAPSPTGNLQRIVFADPERPKREPQAVAGALAYGCDTFFYIVAGPRDLDAVGRPLRYYEPDGQTATPFAGLGIERLNRHLRGFGFGAPTGIGLPGESAGLVADEKWKLEHFPGNPWSLGDTLETAVGRGYTLVTPLQAATATAALANGGTLYRPQLVLDVTNAEGDRVLTPRPVVAGTVGITRDRIEAVRRGMLASAQRGAVAGLRERGALPEQITLGAMAGETGKVGGEARTAWFTAFAPYDRPELAIAVVVEGGTGADRANSVGAQALRRYLAPGRE